MVQVTSKYHITPSIIHKQLPYDALIAHWNVADDCAIWSNISLSPKGWN